MDGLGLLFAALVLGVGTLVLAYCPRYLSPEAAHGRFYALLTAFGVARVGLVLAGDVLLLFVCWELTSVLPLLLVAGSGRGDRAATRALLVTSGGGLALLAGLVLMTGVAGTSDLGTLLAEPGRVTGSPLAPWIAALIVLGAVTKSAQLPFHFWLPGAMVALTPAVGTSVVGAGVLLMALGSVGLVRLPDAYARASAVAKPAWASAPSWWAWCCSSGRSQRRRCCSPSPSSS